MFDFNLFAPKVESSVDPGNIPPGMLRVAQSPRATSKAKDEEVPYLSNEVMADVLQFVTRNELDVLEMVDPRFQALILRHCSHIQRRVVYHLEVSHRGYVFTLSEDGSRRLHVTDTRDFVNMLANSAPLARVDVLEYVNAVTIPKSIPTVIMRQGTKLRMRYVQDQPWCVHRVTQRLQMDPYGPKLPFSWTMKLVALGSPITVRPLEVSLKPNFPSIEFHASRVPLRIQVSSLFRWMDRGRERVGVQGAIAYKKTLVVTNYPFSWKPSDLIDYLLSAFAREYNKNAYEITFEKLKTHHEMDGFRVIHESNPVTGEVFEVFPLQEEFELDEDDGVWKRRRYRTWVIRRSASVEEVVG